jgi:uncharacterized membrane protein YhaH (DUF805 family)
MEFFLLQAHSGWRWVVLLLIVIVTVKALMGWQGKQKWTRLDSNLLLYSRIAVYIQVVLGVILYILLQRWTNMRFTGEHVLTAILAVGGLEFGAARARKARGDANKFRFAFIGFVIALILVLIAIGGATAWTFV